MIYVMSPPLTTASGVRDVYIAEERFCLVATSGGIDCIDLFKGYVISSGTLPSEPVSVAVNWQESGSLPPFARLYVGTSTSGIFDMNYVKVREEGSDFTGELVQRFTTTSAPPISDNNVLDLDALPGRLLIGTGAGVDFIFEHTEYATRSLVSGTSAVRLTEAGGGYWATASGVFEGSVEVNYDLLSTTGTSIIDVDFEYSNTSNPALPAEPPFDITVSEADGQLPAIGVATSGGAFVFEEEQGNEAAARNKVLSAEEFISVDFGPDSFFDGGCLNAATVDLLRVFGLSDNAVSGTHTQVGGDRDQSVVTGTITIVRAVDAGFCPPEQGDFEPPPGP